MSIYLVDFKNDKGWQKYISDDVKEYILQSECVACKQQMNKGKELWAYHAVPYGYGWGEWYCSEECMGKGP